MKHLLERTVNGIRTSIYEVPPGRRTLTVDDGLNIQRYHVSLPRMIFKIGSEGHSSRKCYSFYAFCTDCTDDLKDDTIFGILPFDNCFDDGSVCLGRLVIGPDNPIGMDRTLIDSFYSSSFTSAKFRWSISYLLSMRALARATRVYPNKRIRWVNDKYPAFYPTFRLDEIMS